MEPPWTTSNLRRLGKCIRDGTPVPEGLPAYADVMLWYNELATSVQRRLADHDWSRILPGLQVEVTSRPKTIDTLREKLQRDHNTPLQNIQDVAGVRFEVEMTLSQQDLVAHEIARLYDHDPAACIRDLRTTPHSGYRAVHVWLRLPGRVEIQVRTHLQGEWANMYEVLADLIGRNIRYDALPEKPELAKLVQSLRDFSTVEIADMEAERDEMEKLIFEVGSSRELLARVSDKVRRQREYQAVETAIDGNETRVNELRGKAIAKEKRAREAMIELRAAFDRSRTK